MASLLSVVMVGSDVFISESLHMLLITQKSELILLSCLFNGASYQINITRILMCSIRNLGSFPCPRCLMPMDLMHMIGTKRDKKQRLTLARVDNLSYRAKISTARELIYESNFAVDSLPVQHLLKPESLVPTEVSCLLL